MSKLISIWLIIPIVILSIAIGFFSVQLYYFDIEEKVNLIEVINLLFTIFIAFYVSIYIQKKNDSIKVEKDLIIQYLKPIIEYGKILYNSVIEDKLGTKEINMVFKNISNNIYYADIFKDECGVSNDRTEIRDTIVDIKKIITGNSIKRNKYIITASQRTNAIVKLKDLEKLIFKEIVLVNRH